MLRFLAGRYLLFGILGIEILLLPFFLPKEAYGEVEYLKFTAFLTQFLLVGAATGFIVRYLKEPAEQREELTRIFALGSFIQASFVCVVLWLLGFGVVALLSFIAMMALVYESISKVHESYLLSMSFKPILSLVIVSLIPVFLVSQVQVDSYVLIGFFIAGVVYIGLIYYSVGRNSKKKLGWKKLLSGSWIKNYIANIKSGFVVNISTVMIFLFFYVDRSVIRDKFPDYLGDYSLSFSIMQLTIVAITAFSYVNIVEFGKSQDDRAGLKLKVLSSLKKCFFLFIVLGSVSAIFSYFASIFYGYDEVFKTTCLMLALFGMANVLSSLNAAHLYLGSVNKVAVLVASSFIVSVSLNYFIDYSSLDGLHAVAENLRYLFYIYISLVFIFGQKVRVWSSSL